MTATELAIYLERDAVAASRWVPTAGREAIR